MVAGVQVVVRWHVSHDAFVVMCFEGLPLAVVPSWQFAHVPAAIPV